MKTHPSQATTLPGTPQICRRPRSRKLSHKPEMLIITEIPQVPSPLSHRVVSSVQSLIRSIAALPPRLVILRSPFSDIL